MKSELFAYNYIIALLEAAKKAAERLKRKKVKRILEKDTAEEDIALNTAIYRYVDDNGFLRAIIKRVQELTGTSNTQELYALLRSLARNSDRAVKPENLYLLKPALDVMRNFVEKCEKLGGGETGDQKPEAPSGDQKLVSLLENSDGPTKEQCEKSKDLFKLFIGKYELTKKNTLFYKRWYYWFMSLPMWKKILIGFLLLVVVFIILLAVFKVDTKVFAALRGALNGDKAVGRKLVNVAGNANQRIKNAAFVAVMDSMPKKAAMYF